MFGSGMADERLLRVLTHISEHSADDPTSRLCVVCAEVTGLSGAGIMLINDEGSRGSVCSTNEVSALIEELQYTLGEGPCMDAHLQHRPVLEPDLAEPAVNRWALFSEPAVAAGARAVFGFPVVAGRTSLGALNLYRDAPGPLTDDQHADALVLADVVGRSIIEMQSGASSGAIGPDLESGTNFRFAVHQAAGMIAVQLDVPVDHALVRLRAHAFSHERLVVDVAHDVIEHRLRFDDDASPTH
jgi:hypothetical protein